MPSKSSSHKSKPRLACIDIRDFALQLLLRQRPSWAGAALAIVEEDDPQAKLLYINRKAATQKIRVGMRYASALSLCPDLRAVTLQSLPIDKEESRLIEALREYTPRLQRDANERGLFWLDPQGMRRLFGPLQTWAHAVEDALLRRGLRAIVVVGYARLPLRAIAKALAHKYARPRPLVLKSPAQEASLAGRVPIRALHFPLELAQELEALGIDHLASFLELDRGELSIRFGDDAKRLHALYADALRLPMQSEKSEDKLAVHADLEPADDNAHRLLFCIKGALHALLDELAIRSLALSALRMRFHYERTRSRTQQPPPKAKQSLLPFASTPTHSLPKQQAAPSHMELRVESARPTRDTNAIIELVRLRLERLRLDARVERIELEAEGAKLDGTQLSLFSRKQWRAAARKHDPDKAARGIARLKATFGEQAVTKAKILDAWLPEKRFTWEPARDVALPSRREDETSARPQLIRRLFSIPERMPSRKGGRPHSSPPIRDLVGPYRLQGGWWDHEENRDYYFAEREDGALLWLFFDRKKSSWFCHGRVE